VQLVGHKSYTGVAVATPNTGISLTSLTGGLASQPSPGDFIAVGYALADVANAPLVIQDASSANYTLVGSELYGDDTRDINLRVAYKFAGLTPDTEFQIDDGFAGDSGALCLMIQVWRGVDPVTPLDVAAVTASGINIGKPNPGSITPASKGAVAVCFSAGSAAAGSTPADLTSSEFTFFQAVSRMDDAFGYGSCAAAHAYFEWVSGAFNPAQFGGGSSSTSDAWASVIFALRPRLSYPATPRPAIFPHLMR
jgi:hypothetical protein